MDVHLIPDQPFIKFNRLRVMNLARYGNRCLDASVTVAAVAVVGLILTAPIVAFTALAALFLRGGEAGPHEQTAAWLVVSVVGAALCTLVVQGVSSLLRAEAARWHRLLRFQVTDIEADLFQEVRERVNDDLDASDAVRQLNLDWPDPWTTSIASPPSRFTPTPSPR